MPQLIELWGQLYLLHDFPKAQEIADPPLYDCFLRTVYSREVAPQLLTIRGACYQELVEGYACENLKALCNY